MVVHKNGPSASVNQKHATTGWPVSSQNAEEFSNFYRRETLQ